MGFKPMPVSFGGILLTAAMAAGAAAPAKQVPIPPIPANLQGALPPLDPPAGAVRLPRGVKSKTTTLGRGGVKPPSVPRPSLPPVEPVAPAEAPDQDASVPTLRTTKPTGVCKVLVPQRPLQIPSAGGTWSVEYRGEPGCLAATSADVAWAHATLRSALRTVNIAVDENTDPEARAGFVYLVTAQASLEVAIEQAGAPRPPARAVAPRKEPVPPAHASATGYPAPDKVAVPRVAAESTEGLAQTHAAAPPSPGPVQDSPPWDPVPPPELLTPVASELPSTPKATHGTALALPVDLALEPTSETGFTPAQDSPPWEPAVVQEVPAVIAVDARPPVEGGPLVSKTEVEPAKAQPPGSLPEVAQDSPPSEPVSESPPAAPSALPVVQDGTASAALLKLQPEGARPGTPAKPWGSGFKGLLGKAQAALKGAVHMSEEPAPAGVPALSAIPAAVEPVHSTSPRTSSKAELSDYDELTDEQPPAGR